MGKYFKYAIGEILLVVIGILIALQINNWNEDRKDRKVELKILKSIKNDLKEDIFNLTDMMAFDSTLIEQNKALMSILEDKTSVYNPNTEILYGNINRYGVFYPQKIGYESLKSTGLEILQSDSLRADIVNLYDFHYGYVSETLDLKKQLYLITNDIFVRELKSTGGPNNLQSVSYKEPADFEGLKQNLNFVNHLRHLFYERINFLNYSQTTLDQMQRVERKVSKQINALTND